MINCLFNRRGHLHFKLIKIRPPYYKSIEKNPQELFYVSYIVKTNKPYYYSEAVEYSICLHDNIAVWVPT